MDTKELNKYIKNYLENDKTQRAIMITAPWGSGKSYYIKNNLCAFLRENNLDYSIVSLYGISDLKDVSKNLYLEIRANALTKKSEKLAAVKIAGKTLLKGVAGFFGIDLSQSEEDLQKLYESIDLTNRLIIFEDIERTDIDIVEFLGYVNNLVEQDGVKVLLIANENEIEKSTDYLRVKEKTISDTINFSSDYYESIKSILEIFDNKYLKKMLEKKDNNGQLTLVNKINKKMAEENCFNYRFLLSACQSVENVLNILGDERVDDPKFIQFIENALIQTLIYIIRQFSHKNSNDNDTINKLIREYYIFDNCDFMLYYLKDHTFNKDSFEKEYDLYLEKQMDLETRKKLDPLYNYYLNTELDVKNAINIVCDKLNNNKINYNEYLRIAYYLLSIKSILNYDEKIDECLNFILSNMKKAIDNGENISINLPALPQYGVQGFEEFKTEMLNIIKSQKRKLIDFDYNPESLSEYYNKIKDNKITFIEEKGFANKLDINKTIEMLKNCSAKQIEVFRETLQHIYMEIFNIAVFMCDDVENLKVLRDELYKITDQSDKIDAIQKLQLKWLHGDLQTIIDKLQGERNVKTE